jgi:hypothetical protein
VNKRYVVDEDGERVAILLEIDDYERLLAQHRAPTADDELPIDGEVLDPEEAERRITEFIASAEKLPGLPVAELADRHSRVDASDMEGRRDDLQRVTEQQDTHSETLSKPASSRIAT